MIPYTLRRSLRCRDAHSYWRVPVARFPALASLRSFCDFRLNQASKRLARGALLRFLLCASLPRSQARALSPNLYLKCLLMIGPALRCESILRRRLPATLQELLQCGLTIRLK